MGRCDSEDYGAAEPLFRGLLPPCPRAGGRGLPPDPLPKGLIEGCCDRPTSLLFKVLSR